MTDSWRSVLKARLSFQPRWTKNTHKYFYSFHTKYTYGIIKILKANKMCFETQMPRTRPIPEVAVIVKTKIQGQGKKLWH
jgi:hypothetical protein